MTPFKYYSLSILLPPLSSPPTITNPNYGTAHLIEFFCFDNAHIMYVCVIKAALEAAIHRRVEVRTFSYKLTVEAHGEHLNVVQLPKTALSSVATPNGSVGGRLQSFIDTYVTSLIVSFLLPSLLPPFVIMCLIIHQ
jgi:hypothetical protein